MNRTLELNVTQDPEGLFVAQVVFDNEQVYEARDKNFSLAYVAAAQYVTSPDNIIPWSK